MAPPDLDPHYQRWNQPEIVDRFADKSARDFFKSETRFLEPIAANIRSVIDVGSASGRFYELLRSLGVQPRYTGIDLSEASVEKGRTLYPGHAFHCANALAFEPAQTADLVNATGVVQHEPEYRELLSRMMDWSDRYVLFDAKLAPIDDHLIDREKSYIATEPPLYFVILSHTQLIAELGALRGVKRVSIYAYATTLNARVRIPDGVGPVASAGILLEKGAPDATPELHIELPEGFETTSSKTGNPCV